MQIGERASLREAVRRIEEAQRDDATALELGGLGLNESHAAIIAPKLSRLTQLRVLSFGYAPEVRDTPRSLRTRSGKRVSNRLQMLPRVFLRVVPNLTHLFLDGNNLTVLPAEIGALTMLQELSLEDNQLVALPTVLASMAALREISLKGNALPMGYEEALKLGVPELKFYMRTRWFLQPALSNKAQGFDAAQERRRPHHGYFTSH